MNVFNRPPAIAEDSLHYFIHLGHLSSSKTDALAYATRFESYVASTLLPSHIWHRDPFELNASRNEKGQWNLEGIMRVGDSVDDEWCVVWLLQEISRRWDVAIRVYDSDGDFLLIEAANTLPDWITPENAENRVWIYQGHLHIIPLEYTTPSIRLLEGGRFGDGDNTESAESTQVDVITLLEAVEAVRDPSVNTLAASEIEHAAFERIRKYPEAARQHVHHTNVYIPREIVMALFESPELVQKAVETFYTRDALHMRDAARMARFSPTDSVLVTVKLTRTAYAQLLSQKFYPPRIFGIWKDPEGSVERRRRDIGMKIACGFEMAYQENKGRDQSIIEEDNKDLLTLKDDPNYQKYIQKLKELGFFNDAMKDSYNRRLLEIRCSDVYSRGKAYRENVRRSFRSLVDAAIIRAQNRLIVAEETELVREEDSDQWLLEAERNMEDIISKHTNIITNVGESSAKNEERVAEEQASQLRHLANEVENFVEGTGEIEGALFNDERNIKDDSDDESIGNSAGELDAVSLSRQAALDSLVPPLDPSDYGKMPASYHDGSQRVRESFLENQDIGDVNAQPGISSEKSGSTSTNTKFIRPLLFSRDRFDGVEDSDDESETDAEEDEEEKPTLVGDIEIDMENEREEFIEFSRDMLGITPSLWNSIIEDRQNRGVFIPTSSKESGSQELLRSPTGEPEQPQKGKGSSKLNSFEAVMDALDIELRRIKEKKGEPKAGVLNTSSSEFEDQGVTTTDLDIDEEMSNELKTMMQEEGNGEHMDYTLIKNFLESFKSQQGLSGPVSNLIGRMGWQLPRDTS